MEDLRWPLTILVIGVLLALAEWLLARRKKGGITFTDKQRMRGIMGVAVTLAILTWVLIQIS